MHAAWQQPSAVSLWHSSTLHGRLSGNATTPPAGLYGGGEAFEYVCVNVSVCVHVCACARLIANRNFEST